MALIKHSASERLVREAIVLDLGDLRRQADDLIERARASAAELAAQAERERRTLTDGAAAKGREDGHKEGFERGRVEGFAQGRAEALEKTRQEVESLLKAWGGALERFEKRREEMLNDARTDILSLAIAIAEKVTRRVVEHDPTAVCAQIEAALSALQKRTRLIVSVHPEDRARAAETLPALIARCGESAHAEVVEDGSLSRGSCVVRTESGEVDATIETQIARIVDAIRPGGDARANGAPAMPTPAGADPAAAAGAAEPNEGVAPPEIGAGDAESAPPDGEALP